MKGMTNVMKMNNQNVDIKNVNQVMNNFTKEMEKQNFNAGNTKTFALLILRANSRYDRNG